MSFFCVRCTQYTQVNIQRQTLQIASHSFQTPHQASARPQILSRNPKIEAQSHCSWNSVCWPPKVTPFAPFDWMITNNALHPAGGEAGANKQRKAFSLPAWGEANCARRQPGKTPSSFFVSFFCVRCAQYTQVNIQRQTLQMAKTHHFQLQE